jgi:hypothetical protein
VPSALSKVEVLELFNSVARSSTSGPVQLGSTKDVREIADMCQQLVVALAR